MNLRKSRRGWMVDGLKINSCEEHLKEAGVMSSEKSNPSGDVHFFQDLRDCTQNKKRRVHN